MISFNISVLFIKTTLLAYVVMYFLTFIILKLKINITDKPNDRKKQKEPISLLGGVCFIITFLLLIKFNEQYIINTLVLLGVVCLIFIVGFIDDICKSKGGELSPLTKFQLFLICSIIFSIVFSLEGYFKGDFIPKIFSKILTTGCIISIINVINFTDGNDGLTSGYTIIIASFLCIFSALKNNIMALFLSSMLIGANLAFVRYNWYPAKIYMGDGGSSTIGFIIGLVELELFFTSLTPKNTLCFVLLMSIPIFDTLRVIIIRIRNKRPFYKADRSQIHLVLVDHKISITSTTKILMLSQLIFSLVSLMVYLL